jgi:hypothetical protein
MKIKKAKWLVILMIVTMLMVMFPVAGMAGIEGDPDVYPLYAGQNILVGHIEVWDDGDDLYVNYVITEEGWFLTETHVQVSKDFASFPKNRSGNVAPGQFAYKMKHDPAVTEYALDPIDISHWEGEIVIAAHAVVEMRECIEGDTGTDKYKSDETTMVTGGNVPDAVYPESAVPANAGAYYGVNAWINGTNSNSWDPAPTWIWESMPVQNPINGDIVWFEKSFEVIGTPTGGSLKIACDNGYAVWLNGKFVGKSDTLPQFVGADDDYDTTSLSDLKEPYVNTTGWATVGTYNLTPHLVEGTNVLKIMGVNEYFNVGDGVNNEIGTVENNPGGLAFSFTVDWETEAECVPVKSETAWAAVEVGANRFMEIGNWATFIKYDLANIVQ